jgi:hypothetical protein
MLMKYHHSPEVCLQAAAAANADLLGASSATTRTYVGYASLSIDERDS